MYPGDPGMPGGDCSGIVIRSASPVAAGNLKPLEPGQAVFGLAGGSLGSHVVASCMALAPMPPCLSFEAAATAPTVFITTDAVLRQAAGLEPGETVFLPAAAGGVGLAALQEVASLGGMVVATAGGPPKRAYLRALGINRVANSRDISFVEDLLLQSSGGVDVVLNTLTSPGLVSSAASMLKQGGRFIEIGKRDIFAAARLAQERPDITFGYVAVDFLPEPSLHSAMQRLSSRLADGSLRPLPSATHAMSTVVSALRQMSQARHIGKVVVSRATDVISGSLSSLGGDSSGSARAGGVGSMGGAGRVIIGGGTGSLGVLLAAWLAELGCRDMLLVGRSGRMSEEAARQLLGRPAGDGHPSATSSAPASSAAVTVVACDASASADLEAMMTVSEAGGGTRVPPAAVIHAGGVLADALLQNQGLGGLRAVLSPKVAALRRWLGHAGGLLAPCAIQVGGWVGGWGRACGCSAAPFAEGLSLF